MNDDQKLLLFFECGDDEYAVECREVLEVIPNIQAEGFIQYHGKKIPVSDFAAIQTGTHSQPTLSTRIILFNTEKDKVVGLKAEKVLHTERFPASAFIKSGSADGISNRQVVTESANIPVINPSAIKSLIKKEAQAGVK